MDLAAEGARAAEMRGQSKDIASITLDERSLCDLELLATGAFSPLRGFMGEADYKRVVAESRLADGTLWPLPVTLPVTPRRRHRRRQDPGPPRRLRQPARLPPRRGDLRLRQGGRGQGRLRHDRRQAPGRRLPEQASRATTPPAAWRSSAPRRTTTSSSCAGRPPSFASTSHKLGWSKVVAFQTRNPLHRAHEELTKRAAAQIGGGLLIHPVVGVTKPGDVDHYTRVRCYRALVDNYYEPGSVVLSLLPLAMRMAGPREVLLHAIIRRNYGCTDFIVGRDHAGPGNDSAGKPFYAPYAAQEAMAEHKAEIGMEMVDFKQMVFLPDEDKYSPVDEVPKGVKTADISGTQVRDDYLAKGLPLPEWFSRPAVAAILNETSPPKFKQGLTIWFTGLSGSGKSTVAHALIERLAEYGRNVSSLDGDEIRTHLSKGLGFSKDDRDANINRVGYVAGLVNQHGGTTLCAVISPYRGPRDNARKLSKGRFVEVYCDTPIEECEKRDVKGLYAKARNAVAEGKGMGFTGVDDPYEAPLNPEVTIDTSKLSVIECADTIIAKLTELGYILPHGHT